MTQMLRTLIMSTLTACLFAGCVYKADIQQGNIITDRDLQQLHPGMSVSQVQIQLGKPLLNNVFPDNRLVYVYTMKRGHKKMTRMTVTVTFINNKVTTIDVSHTPPLSHRKDN